MRAYVTIEDAITGVDAADVEAPDMDQALELALDDLGRPLTGRDEGTVTIRIRVES